VEDIDYQTPRGLDRALLRSLAAESEWVKQHLNIFVTITQTPLAGSEVPAQS